VGISGEGHRLSQTAEKAHHHALYPIHNDSSGNFDSVSYILPQTAAFVQSFLEMEKVDGIPDFDFEDL
jgi:hypothetical protein